MIRTVLVHAAGGLARLIGTMQHPEQLSPRLLDTPREMIVRVRTSTSVGIAAIPVEVEVSVRGGPPRFHIIGLGDNAVRESRDRILSALRISGFEVPDQILVNLAPAEVKKEGSGFDLPIALGILCASQQIHRRLVHNKQFLGELSLDGSLKAVRGALISALLASEEGSDLLVVAKDNGAEARLVQSLPVQACGSLLSVVAFLRDGESPDIPHDDPKKEACGEERTFDDVIGQERAKRALMLAACGRHNILLVGPPGCGKSMLAARFSSLLPKLTQEEILETVKIHSVAGLGVQGLFQGLPPFRNPHFGASEAGMIGGGSPIRPGEVSLAHCGVLFLDEMPEFRRGVLESLRAPMEGGEVHLTRVRNSVRFPSRFLLVGAMNPCPCGKFGMKGGQCLCGSVGISKYRNRISQPILDRIDLVVEMEGVPLNQLVDSREQTKKGTYDSLQEALRLGRSSQQSRGGKYNAELSSGELNSFTALKGESKALLERAADKLNLSARGYVRVLRVARTIADCAGESAVSSKHIAEALSYRWSPMPNR